VPANKGDALRTPNNAYLADSRSSAFGLNDITDQYNRIESYCLSDSVPDVVVTQYEVARNLYLYAYNVYRFYMTAHHQVLITLEYAIKHRFGEDEIKRYAKEIGRNRGLATCLKYVFGNAYVINSDFSIWKNKQRIDAENDYQIKKIEEMEEKGLGSIDLDYSEIEYDKYSIEWDYVSVLTEILPKIRNTHAHGSRMLHNQVLLTFENVSVIINKIYQS